MLFSTKAEYGVRLMVELGRQPGSAPVSLSAVAEAERLPLSYLEHLVAKLRKAGLVTSTRGAHGGYRLAKPAEEITMDAVVEALEGQIAPMECFHETPEGKVLCSHESDGDHACATKLLWTRVQGGVTKALAGTTLAELVEFAGGPAAGRAAGAGRQRRLSRHETHETETKLAELEIRNLHVSVEDKEILRGLDLDVEKGKVHALMGPNGSGKSTLANAIMGHPALEVTEGTITFKGEDMTEADPDERSRAGLFMAFQYPVAIPGVSVSKYLRMILNAHREARGEPRDQDQRVRQDRPGGDGAGQHPQRLLQPLPQRRLLRRREEADGAAAAGAAAARDRGPRRDRLRASTSTPCGPSPTASTSSPAPTWAS